MRLCKTLCNLLIHYALETSIEKYAILARGNSDQIAALTSRPHGFTLHTALIIRMPVPTWLKGAPKLPTTDKDPKRVNNMTGTTTFAYTGVLGGSPDLAGPATPADLELWRKERAEKIVRGEDPGIFSYSRSVSKLIS